MRFITRRILSTRPVAGVGKPGFVCCQRFCVPGNLPIGFELERDYLKALTAALQQVDDARLLVGVDDTVDDPEFLAVREGRFVVQDEPDIVV
ncbi:hypothetical protein [Mesorhizobium sp. M2D.F.Ca.ET.206.01.1.1]|uniref:hypothetical protein n=1 Tax=Mesorhizobium sp. M2D.F.Ca.ET.206.01.1.1 TaxID=2563939 RepID=UPI001FDF7210|nr:hypothetical protein [Mesorhizobium sp. M2D.F.Ca.ET.206.01.1.1]